MSSRLIKTNMIQQVMEPVCVIVSAGYRSISPESCYLMLHYFCMIFADLFLCHWGSHYKWETTISHSCSFLGRHCRPSSHFDLLLPVVLVEFLDTQYVQQKFETVASLRLGTAALTTRQSCGVQNSLESGNEMKGRDGTENKTTSSSVWAGGGHVAGLQEDESCVWD